MDELKVSWFDGDFAELPASQARADGATSSGTPSVQTDQRPSMWGRGSSAGVSKNTVAMPGLLPFIDMTLDSVGLWFLRARETALNTT